MATLTGENLLNSIMESTGVELNMVLFATTSARLQQMIDNGTYSKLSAGIVVSSFSTAINNATEINDLVDVIEANAALIEAADEEDVDDIVFPPIGEDDDPDDPVTQTLDIGSYDGNDINWETLDAGQGSFLFTDDASVETFVVITNFSSDDQIQISNLPDGASYVFTPNGNDVDITYNYNDETPMNHIKLIGVGSTADIYDDEAGFEAAIGFNAVTYI